MIVLYWFKKYMTMFSTFIKCFIANPVWTMLFKMLNFQKSIVELDMGGELKEHYV